MKNPRLMCFVAFGSTCVQVIDIFLFNPFFIQEAVAVEGMQLTAVSQKVLVT